MKDKVNHTVIDQLPPPPAGKTGWPWTVQTQPHFPAQSEEISWPRISIVTPSFNQGQFIEETIRSVLLQGYPNLEYVVIDGESTDNTIEIIKKYEPYLTYWCSESDRGQSHALNKGIARCTGDIFNWINSDDLLGPGALYAVAGSWIDTPGRIITGKVINFNEQGDRETIVPRNLTLNNFIRWREAERNGLSWHQPGIYLPLDAVKQAGGLREDLTFSMDHLLMIEMLQHCQVTYIEDTLAYFRYHLTSKTITAGHPRFRLERLRAIRAMKKLPLEIPASELREDHARTLISCAAAEIKDQHLFQALCYVIQAFCLSRWMARATIRETRLLDLFRQSFMTKLTGRNSPMTGVKS